jgi:DNA-binding transcriptional LysR family regulator
MLRPKTLRYKRILLSLIVAHPYGDIVGRVKLKRGPVIEKLEYLIVLAREKNFGRAAEACGVSQPTFSAGVKHLEEVLGMPLVQRSSRFRGLTPEGARVLEWAQRICADMRAMREEVAAMKRGRLTGRLTIAVVPTALAMVSTLTGPFLNRHPDVRVTIYSRTSNEVLSMLQNFEIDAGLTYVDNEPLGRVRAVPLYPERYRLLAAVSNPLSQRKSVAWKELGEVPLCLLTGDMQNRRIIDGLLKEAGVQASPALESNSIIVLAAHVRAGRWATILPEQLAKAMETPGVTSSAPITGPESTHTIGLVTLERNLLSPLAAALVQEARRWGGEGASGE